MSDSDASSADGGRGLLIVDEFVTLDGVLQSPGQPSEDLEGGFAHGGWQAPFTGAETGPVVTEQIERMDALLLGRRTYDIFAGYWPHVPAGNPIGDHLNRVPKYVASRSDLDLSWDGATQLSSPIDEAVARLKDAHREIHVIGSGDLLQSLLAADLVDGFNLWIFPVVLGSGKRIFADGAIPVSFAATEPPLGFENGVVRLVLRRAGEVRYGDMSARD